MNKNEYVKEMFDEAKHEMRKYFTTLPENDKNFEEFELQYDNELKSIILFVKYLNGNIKELDRWNSFNLTMFKQLISLSNDFTKSENYKLWDVIPIVISMRL